MRAKAEDATQETFVHAWKVVETRDLGTVTAYFSNVRRPSAEGDVFIGEAP